MDCTQILEEARRERVLETNDGGFIEEDRCVNLNLNGSKFEPTTNPLV